MHTDEEYFRTHYIGHVTTREGVIVQVFRDGRLRVTDFLPGGIDRWFRVQDPARVFEAAEELARHNGWTGIHVDRFEREA